MPRRNGLDRLDLDDYFVFHNQVRPESRLDPRAWINYGNNLLPDRAQAWLFQLVCQDRCVGRFQQAGSEAGMNAVGRLHDLLRHLVFVHVQSKTISRKAAKIAKKTPAAARQCLQARSEDPLSGRAWAFSLCSIVFVESRNPKCERRTPCNILRTNIGPRFMEH